MLHKMRQNSLDELVGSWDRFHFTTIVYAADALHYLWVERGLLYVLFVIPGFYNGHTHCNHVYNQIIFKWLYNSYLSSPIAHNTNSLHRQNYVYTVL